MSHLFSTLIAGALLAGTAPLSASAGESGIGFLQRYQALDRPNRSVERFRIDPRFKSGDFFGATGSIRPWRALARTRVCIQ